MKLTILYGSATGNAEHIAKELASSINNGKSSSSSSPFFDSADVMECNHFKRKKLFETWSQPPSSSQPAIMKRHALIVVCSTSGNGDAPENASRFVRHIKKPPTATTSMPLEHVAYIGWQVPQLVPRVNANKFSAISCWFWTVYIVGDFWMSCLKWKELKMKMSDLGERMLIGRTKRCADGDDVNEEKENTMVSCCCYSNTTCLQFQGTP